MKDLFLSLKGINQVNGTQPLFFWALRIYHSQFQEQRTEKKQQVNKSGIV